MSNDFNPTLSVDTLLDQLKNTPQNFTVGNQGGGLDLPEVSATVPTEDGLGAFIIEKTAQLVDSTLKAFKDIKNLAVTSNDPETIEALASLVKASSGALDTLNKINIQNKKTQAAKEIANIQAEARKKAAETLTGGNTLLTGSREEVLKMIGEVMRQKQVDGAVDAELIEDTKPGAILELTNGSDDRQHLGLLDRTHLHTK